MSSNTKRLEGRTALITGSTGGLGVAVATALAAEGAFVIVSGRDKTRGDAVVADIRSAGGAAEFVVADLGAGEDEVRRLAEQATAVAGGRIDILVNNAALPLSTRFPDLTAEEWRRSIEVNLTAPFLMTKAVLPAMRSQHYGGIINISSSAGRMVSTLGGAHYTASKAGLLGLTRAAAKELGKFGITVNAICPGIIDTELTREHASDELLERLAASYPVPRLGTALEVADLICFAASEAAGYITSASLDINGGDLMM
jgi:NAD(P)-dependent dehydrogenase (short-subunit alcohol dehydrogenase family)